MTADFSFLVKTEKEGEKMLKTIREMAEKKSFECRDCGESMTVAYKPYNFPYRVRGECKEFTILNAPYYKCDNCNNEVVSVLLYADVEKVIEREIFLRLNNKEEIPDEIDFSAFITE